MTDVFESLLPVFALILLGFGLRKSEIVPLPLWAGLETVVYWVFFPALLAHTLIVADLRSVPLGALSFTLMLSVATIALVLIALKRPLCSRLKLSDPAFTSLFQTSTRWNGFIALAIVAKLFGDLGIALVAVALAALVPLVNVMNVTVLARFGANGQTSAAGIVIQILRNPFILASAVGLIINLARIPVYGPVLEVVHLLSSAALATGLLVVGAGLSLKSALTPSPVVWVASAAKLAALPAITIGWATLFGLSGIAFETAILCAAVPTAVNGYVMARKMGGDAPLFASIHTVQTALSMATIPAFIWLVRAGGW